MPKPGFPATAQDSRFTTAIVMIFFRAPFSRSRKGAMAVLHYNATPLADDNCVHHVHRCQGDPAKELDTAKVSLIDAVNAFSKRQQVRNGQGVA
jgi:hypothetical protein